MAVGSNGNAINAARHGGRESIGSDDTRHKIILIRALHSARQRKSLPIGAADLARQYVEFPRSDIIEQDMPNQTWWEAHVPFVSAFAILALCDFDPLAAMLLELSDRKRYPDVVKFL